MTLVSVLAVSGGLALLVVVFVDLVWTTLGVSHGAGPLTSVVLRAGWWAGAPLRRRQAHGAIAMVGVATVLTTLAVWVVILWAAWASMFLGAGGGIVDRTGADAGAWDRIYFAGYSVFTLGNGEFQPEGPPWQIATVMAALSGLTMISLAIAYLVLVTSAAAERHATAATLSLLGPTPADIVQRWWSSRDRDPIGFDRDLAECATQIVELTHRHLPYPVLHFFHTNHRRASPPVAIATLDDALTLLSHGVARRARPTPSTLLTARAAIDDYLELVGSHYSDPMPHPPPPLSLGPLDEAGIPTAREDEFNRELLALTSRRENLHGLVAAEGFNRADDTDLADRTHFTDDGESTPPSRPERMTGQ